MIAYCPHCGHTEFMSYKGGDLLLCKACSKTTPPARRGYTRLKLEAARLVTAAVWLAGQYGSFTRSEMAAHLGVSNSPALRSQLDELAGRGILNRVCRPHEQNGRPTWFFSRPAVAASTARNGGATRRTTAPARPSSFVAVAAGGAVGSR